MNNLAKPFLPFLCAALLQYVLVCLEMPAFSGCLHSDRVAVWIVSSHASQSSVSQRRCLCILYVTGKNDVSAQTGLPTLAAEWYFSMSGARALHSYAVLHSLLMINGEIDYPVWCTDRRGAKSQVAGYTGFRYALTAAAWQRPIGKRQAEKAENIMQWWWWWWARVMGYSESTEDWRVFRVGVEIKRVVSKGGKGSETVNRSGCGVRDMLFIKRRSCVT